MFQIVFSLNSLYKVDCETIINWVECYLIFLNGKMTDLPVGKNGHRYQEFLLETGYIEEIYTP